MKYFKRILLLVLIIGIAYGVNYAWRAFPIISGFGAKNLCSCVMVAGRTSESVLNEELSKFPLNLGSYAINYEDSTVTGKVFGLAKQKAVFHKGLGCSLMVEVDEDKLKSATVKLTRLQQPSVDSIQWPLGDLHAVDTTSLIDRTKLNSVLDDAFSEPGPDSLRRTRAIVVVHHGKIVAERYKKGFNKDSKLIGWSMTKSITNALVGILVKDGKLDVHAAANIPEWKNDGRQKITLHHLMQASSGLDWEENYSGPSGATNMLFKKSRMGYYAAETPLKYEPGEVFYYSSGTTNIISRIVRETVGDNDYYDFPYEKLFAKIGMNNTIIEPDAGGTFVGSSYSFGTARDWARFGLLYLNDGVFNGERILPEGWVKYTTTPAKGADKGQYGAQFWLNAGAKNDPANRYYPDVATDLFWADGFEGQNIFILPSSNLVVVKLSMSHGDYLDDNKFLADIVEAVSSTSSAMINQ